MRRGSRAVVVGGSMAGQLTARVLSDHFEEVVLVERDKLNDVAEARRGQPQARHLHGLLGKGLSLMTHYFPDLYEALKREGAIPGDMGRDMLWYTNGGYRLRFESGLIGMMMSRPLLEWLVRRRVAGIANVRVLDECDVKEPVATPDRSRVIGVRTQRRTPGSREETLDADLVVDASGRGSSSPKWLEALGYARPPESTIRIDMSYATRVYRRRPGDFEAIGANLIMITPVPPDGRRSGFMFPMEGDRWIVTLGGWHNDGAPTDEQGFLEYARSLPAPDIHRMLPALEPLGDFMTHRLPSDLRRHYERLERFPDGYLVVGDAVCSFNPVYGQGMTSAALQAHELDRTLQDGSSLKGLSRRYFRRSSRLVDRPWQMAAGEDFRFAETTGPRPAGTDLINAYTTRVNRATHTDPVVYRGFLEVMNLMKPAPSLMRPGILWRVLRAAGARSAVPAVQASRAT